MGSQTIVIIKAATTGQGKLGKGGRGDALRSVSLRRRTKWSNRLLTPPVHTSPPGQPPSTQELGPGLTLKSQSRRPFKSLNMGQKPTIDDDREPWQYPNSSSLPIIWHCKCDRSRSRCLPTVTDSSEVSLYRVVGCKHTP